MAIHEQDVAMCKRRDFLKLAACGAAVASFGGVLSACVGGSSTEGAESVLATDQVIVAMNTGSEPAAGFDPLRAWVAASMSTSPLFSRRLLRPTRSGIPKRPRDRLFLL